MAFNYKAIQQVKEAAAKLVKEAAPPLAHGVEDVVDYFKGFAQSHPRMSDVSEEVVDNAGRYANKGLNALGLPSSETLATLGPRWRRAVLAHDEYGQNLKNLGTGVKHLGGQLAIDLHSRTPMREMADTLLDYPYTRDVGPDTLKAIKAVNNVTVPTSLGLAGTIVGGAIPRTIANTQPPKPKPIPGFNPNHGALYRPDPRYKK